MLQAGAMTDRKHAFPAIVDSRTRVAVVGSLPGERSLAAQQYYAHPQNQFWQLIGEVIEKDLTPLDYHARLTALLDARIGLWDVVATARRTGSTDAAIRDHQARDLTAFIRDLPSLRAIGFNGGTAHAIGTRALGSDMPHVARILLPSSSPLHTAGLAAKLPAWLQLRGYLD
jgi:hypoxanthine-DNA glycosylase